MDGGFYQDVFYFILTYLNVWSDLRSVEDLKIVRLSQAMSNFVFTIENKRHSLDNGNLSGKDLSTFHKKEPQKILLRIYGEQMEHLLPPGRELKWCLLFSELGIGAKIYCAFANGRFEEYFDSEMLNALSLRDANISCRIASKIAKIHLWIDKLALEKDKKNELWDRFEDWMEKAIAVPLSESRRLLLQRVGFPTFVQQKLQRLKNELQSLENDLPLVFSHCDLQYGNILRMKYSQRIILIDFEYACFAPPFFDIANHWCEWAANYTKSSMEQLLDFTQMPSAVERRAFVRSYLQEQAASEVSDQEVDAFVQNCNKYISLSHFMWGIWGILKMRDDETPLAFDYFAYALKRLEMFLQEDNALY